MSFSERIRGSSFGRIAVVAASLSLGSSGCHDWVAVRPTEVAKMRADKEVLLEKEGGALVETDTSSDVRILTKDGKSYYFSSPVEAAVNNRVLAIRGSNRGEKRIPLDDIDKVEIEKFSGGQTAMAIVASSLAFLLLIFVAQGGAKGATD